MTSHELNKVFSAAHQNGAARHPCYWLKAHIIATDVIQKLGQRPHDPVMKAVASVLVLRLLDWLQPVGIPDDPTDDNIWQVAQKLTPPRDEK